MSLLNLNVFCVKNPNVRRTLELNGNTKGSKQWHGRVMEIETHPIYMPPPICKEARNLDDKLVNKFIRAS